MEDLEDNARETIAELFDGPVEFRVISTKGKGERLDRPELDEIEAADKSGDYDVFVYDDLSRLIRGGEAARLLGVGVDNGTRSICIDDGIDMVGHLMCSGSRNHFCWNSIHIDGSFVVDLVRTEITKVLYQLEGFDDQFRQILDEVQFQSEDKPSAQLKQLEADVAQLAREKENLLAAMRMFGPKEMIVNDIEAIESRERDLARRRYLIEKAVKKPLVLPKSVADLRASLEAQFQPLNVESYEFGTLLRQIVPEFCVYLVRLIDGGHESARDQQRWRRIRGLCGGAGRDDGARDV